MFESFDDLSDVGGDNLDFLYTTSQVAKCDWYPNSGHGFCVVEEINQPRNARIIRKKQYQFRFELVLAFFREVRVFLGFGFPNS